MAIDPLEPVVIQMNVPDPPGPFNRFKQSRFVQALGANRTTKIITAGSAVVISVTMVATAIFVVLANDKDFKKSHGLDTLPKPPAQVSGSVKNADALPGGGVATGKGACIGQNCPEITFTADPATTLVGKSVKLAWSATKSPKTCVASDDWSGNKSPSGSESSPTLSKLQSYLFTLTCKTDTGTGFSSVPVGTTVPASSLGSGNIKTRPSVSISANPAGNIYVGGYTTIKWEATNSPTSCKASGDWSGVKSSSGSEKVGPLTTEKNYYFKLNCVNSSGESGEVPATAEVIAVPSAYAGLPIVNLSANPVGPINPGSSTVLSWSASNNPTSCTASGDWTGTKPGSGSFNTGALNIIKTYSFGISCTNSVGSTSDVAAIQVLPNPPAVSLTVSPSSMLVGNSATISWNVSNTTPATTCTGSGDWPGSTAVTPTSSGSKSTGTLNTAKTYIYSLTCVNEGGTGFQKNVPLTVSLPPPPVVSISVNPISISTGQSSTITWSATNNPTSCTPTGDLAGPITPLSGGSKSTGTLNTARTYSYSLQCSNAGGASNVAQTSLTVGSGTPATQPPVVTISASPSSISTGSSSTISWSATNSPTSCSASGTTTNWVNSPGASGSTSTGVISSAGTRTYTITCTNSAGSGSKSVTLTIVALPTVSVTLGASSINTGASTTYSWSSTNATSCTGGGSLSGAMATSGGPTSTGVKSTAGTYNYTVTCVNSIGGSNSATAVLTVSNAAPVYCGGLTPCYGPNDLAAHASPGNCWGWNLTWVINITTYRPNHPGGGSGSIESAAATCNHSIASVLAGSASIPGYSSGGKSTQNHQSVTKNNSAGSQLAGYRVGYYDAAKP